MDNKLVREKEGLYPVWEYFAKKPNAPNISTEFSSFVFLEKGTDEEALKVAQEYIHKCISKKFEVYKIEFIGYR